jgi:hypothetical protein
LKACSDISGFWAESVCPIADTTLTRHAANIPTALRKLGFDLNDISTFPLHFHALTPHVLGQLCREPKIVADYDFQPNQPA